MTKKAYFGPKLIVFGPMILIFAGGSKSFGTHVTQKPPGHLVRIVFWSIIADFSWVACECFSLKNLIIKCDQKWSLSVVTLIAVSGESAVQKDKKEVLKWKCTSASISNGNFYFHNFCSVNYFCLSVKKIVLVSESHHMWFKYNCYCGHWGILLKVSW